MRSMSLPVRGLAYLTGDGLLIHCLITGLSLVLGIGSRAHSRPISTFGIQPNKEGAFFGPSTARLQLETANGKDSGAWRDEVIVAEMFARENVFRFLAF
jgi:hypothetical protein